jgi:hypothetical protein
MDGNIKQQIDEFVASTSREVPPALQMELSKQSLDETVWSLSVVSVVDLTLGVVVGELLDEHGWHSSRERSVLFCLHYFPVLSARHYSVQPVLGAQETGGDTVH